MGRAIHTNYNAKFSCDVLKLAMIKVVLLLLHETKYHRLQNEWLANRFGGKTYDVICRFEPSGGDVSSPGKSQ